VGTATETPMSESGSQRSYSHVREGYATRGPQSIMELRGMKFGLARDDFKLGPPPPAKLFVGIELDDAQRYDFPLLETLKTLEMELVRQFGALVPTPGARSLTEDAKTNNATDSTPSNSITLKGCGVSVGDTSNSDNVEPLHFYIQAADHDSLLEISLKCDSKLAEIRTQFEIQTKLFEAWRRMQFQLDALQKDKSADRTAASSGSNATSDTRGGQIDEVEAAADDFDALIEQTVTAAGPSSNAKRAESNENAMSATAPSQADADEYYDPLMDLTRPT